MGVAFDGSDLDDDVANFEFIDDVQNFEVVDISLRQRRNVYEFPADYSDVAPELLNQLNQLDIDDDLALRQMLDKDSLHFDWSADPSKFAGTREDFSGPSGPTFSVQGLSALEIFEKIWDRDIIKLIVRETNRYAQVLKQNSSLKQHSRLNQWQDVDEHDIWLFFAVIMLQSFVPNPVEREYWHPKYPYLKIGNFSDIMFFHKFTLIKKCLHFVDNDLPPTGDKKLFKIQPIIDHLNHTFSSLYLPEQNIALDESLLLWKGRLSFAQLISNKAAKVGIKSYELCESRTGYLWKMIIYSGKGQPQLDEDHGDETNETNEPQGATSQIVFNLVRPLFNKGHSLVMDNFYNSPLLSRALKAKKTDTMGTLRLNREFVPDSLKNKTKSNMRTGEVCCSQTEDLSIVVWKDSNIVSLISTYHPAEVAGKEKYGYYKYKPKVVLDYNSSMGGVDKKDQLLQAFPVERVRNSVWYKKLFRRLLNVSINNANVIYGHLPTNKISTRDFRMQLADQILRKHGSACSGSISRVVIPDPIPVAPGQGHFPVRNATGRNRCKRCSQAKISRRTPWCCDNCHVNLCIDGCFKLYHTQ